MARWATAGLLLATASASAQVFQYSSRDLVAEFRRSGSSDLSINLGSIDTFTGLGAGQTIDLSNRYSVNDQLLSTFGTTDSLSFSVIGTHKFGLSNPTEPQYTSWLTTARTDLDNATSAPNRYTTSKTQSIQAAIGGILGDGAAKGALVYGPNASYPPSSSTALVIPTSGVDAVHSYTSLYTGTGGLKSLISSPGIENTTGTDFSSSGGVARSDLYEYKPGSPTLKADYLGVFSLDNFGHLSFTAVPEPSEYGAVATAALLAGAAWHRRNRAAKS
jgi:hypothetical protein